MALLALLALAAIAPALGNNDAGSLRISYPLGLLGHRPDWRSTKPSVNDLLYNADSYGHFMLAQFAEDAYIYENWFYGMENGVVVESGALNGLRYSTTFLLQYYAHWTPVHIEASPSNYDELIKLRPDSINVNAALCNMFQTLHYVESVQAPVKGILEFMEPRNVYQWYISPVENNITLHIPTRQAQRILNNSISRSEWAEILDRLVAASQPPTIPCVAIKHILHELNVPRVDLWVLDVEGAELEALRGVDFDAVSIDTIVMECDGVNTDKDAEKMQLLAVHNYTCRVLTLSCFCTHRTFLPSVKPESKKSHYKDLYARALRRNFRYVIRDPRLQSNYKSLLPLDKGNN